MTKETKLSTYLEMLFHWNRAAGLTAFRTPREARRYGVTPSLAASSLLDRDAQVLDVGSGGGFPAVPLAIARPDLSVLCCEPSTQKALFLQEVARVLALPLRVETRQVEVLLRTPLDVEAVTVRGVRLRKGVVKKLVRCLGEGGLFLVWTGGDSLLRYATWLEELGLKSSERPLPDAGVSLLTGIVPRGTSPAPSVEEPGDAE